MTFCIYELDLVLLSKSDRIVVELSGRHYWREGEESPKKKARNDILRAYGFRLVHLLTSERELADYLHMS